MTQIPILSGVYTDESPEIRSSYPVNLVPVPKESGISQGYLRPADGIVANATGTGLPRGGINWNGSLYRVTGADLVKVLEDGTVSLLGSLAGVPSGQVSMTYSFDRLAIASSGNLFLWDGTTLVQVTDPDLGVCLDVVWVDGYFMTTDGTSLVVTELTDPTSVNPLKYGSAEADPDPIMAIKKVRNEIYALNRYTTEVYSNVGGQFFPFQRIVGAQIQKGCVGTHACCEYMDGIAFVGSGVNEAPSVYIGANGMANKIGTSDIDKILATYTDAELASIRMEVSNDRSNEYLMVHLLDRTMVFDRIVGMSAGGPVWFTFVSAVEGFSQYLAKDFVWCYSRWNVAHPTSTSLGVLDTTVGTHWGNKVRWEFGTLIVYNEGRGAIFHELELVTLPGRVALGDDPSISTSYSLDGETWSQDKSIAAGKQGDRLKRLVWRRQGSMTHWRIQRFRGDSSSRLSFVRLEAQLEPLAV